MRDVAKVTGPHSEVPLRVVGAGRARKAARRLAGATGCWFKARSASNTYGWPLLCDEMGVYTE